MKRHTNILCAIALGALSVVACESDTKSSNAPTSIDEVVSAWTEVGLDASKLAAADERALEATQCRRGPISGVEVTICSYAEDSAALAAREAGLKQIGETTGTALPAGKLLLVIADRDKADPNGKAINTIAKTFKAVAGG
jgi:hypothetical protein